MFKAALFPIVLGVLFCACSKDKTGSGLSRVLVLTETAGYRHESISAGVAMLKEQAKEWRISVGDTGQSSAFTEENLGRYELVILLNTTGDLFSEDEKLALQSFIRSGGSLMGIHAAADAEYAWAWYGQMLGGWFDSHPPVQQAVCEVRLHGHPSVRNIGSPWTRTDEWYNFKSLQPDNQVVLTVDENSYTGGTHGALHPVSWYREFDGGRIFYTAMGHTPESYSEPLFVRHIGGAIEWLLRR